MADCDWGNPPGAAGPPGSPEALPACPEGRPAPGGELQVRGQRFPLVPRHLSHVSQLFPVLPAAVAHQSTHPCPAQSPALMGWTTFLTTYKVRPRVTPVRAGYSTSGGGVTSLCLCLDCPAAWSSITSGDFTVRRLPGAHFYLKDAANEKVLLDYISKQLETAHMDYL